MALRPMFFAFTASAAQIARTAFTQAFS